MQQTEDRLMKAEEAAELLQMPLDSLYKELRKETNEIPFLKVGRQYRFSKLAILKKARGEA